MRVTITKRIPAWIGGSSADVQLRRVVDLPIAPFAGLAIVDDAGFEAIIDQVTYHLDDKTVYAIAADDESLIRLGAPPLSADARRSQMLTLVGAYLDTGWAIGKPGLLADDAVPESGEEGEEV